ncbi:MAG: alpha/beta fold hydrolase [Desulfonauticus sp.]|nr:alpha/beta fold hydrolase [Desulfonauticus sp.]
MNSLNCLLLHGFGGSPFELKELESFLQNHNISTLLPCLPGHNTNVNDFAKTNYSHWLAKAKACLRQLQQDNKPVVVVGFSMGGTLALNLAQEDKVDALIIIAAPVFLTRIFPPLASDWRLFFVPILKHIKPFFPVKASNPQSRQIAPWQGYEGCVALWPLDSFLKNMKIVKQHLNKITCPLQAIYSITDKTVPLENAYYILRHINSSLKQLCLLKIRENITSAHMLPTHQETKLFVFHNVLEFIKNFQKNFYQGAN